MKKRVNIYPRRAITTVNPPIRSIVKRVTKEVSDIRKCIIAGAKVEEVLANGTFLVLNLNNYDKDNGGDLSLAGEVRIANAAPPITEDLPEPEKTKPSKDAGKVTVEPDEDRKPPKHEEEVPEIELMKIDELFDGTVEAEVKAEEIIKPEEKVEETTKSVEEKPVVEEKPAEEDKKVETTTESEVKTHIPYKSMSKKERREARKQEEMKKAAENTKSENTEEVYQGTAKFTE